MTGVPCEVDLRSDTVTRPCLTMREAMASAEVGDDVYGEDPTVQKLEQEVAQCLGKEAGLFVTSGTQGNVCAILSLCRPGDEVLIGESGHSFRYEGGAPSALAGVQTHAVPVRSDGSLCLRDLQERLRPADIHHPPQRLLVLENTKDGRPLTQAYLEAVTSFLSRQDHLRAHLDGARLFNAAVALGCQAAPLAAGFTTVTVCLSKGLGAPAGSVLCGPRSVIEHARRWRKMLGGGLRQVGVLAAAGRVAFARRAELAADHKLAEELGAALARLERVSIVRISTNMVYARIAIEASAQGLLVDSLRSQNIRWPGGSRDGEGTTFRLVTHRDLPDDTVGRVVHQVEKALA